MVSNLVGSKVILILFKFGLIFLQALYLFKLTLWCVFSLDSFLHFEFRRLSIQCSGDHMPFELDHRIDDLIQSLFTK